MEEEYQFVKNGREHYGCGEEYNVEKMERGSNFIFPLIFRLLGRISSGEEVKATEIMGEKIKIKKNGDWEEYQFVGNFVHPWKIHLYLYDDD